MNKCPTKTEFQRWLSDNPAPENLARAYFSKKKLTNNYGEWLRVTHPEAFRPLWNEMLKHPERWAEIRGDAGTRAAA